MAPNVESLLRYERSNLDRVAVKNLVHAIEAVEPLTRKCVSVESNELATKRSNPSRPKAPQHRWTPEDDSKVLSWVAQHGPRKWTQLSVAVFASGRSPAQLRARYIDVLNPSRVEREWTPQEDAKLLELYSRIGTRWTLIADELEGRVANDVKNRFRLLARAQRPKESIPSFHLSP
mmetsp:Transcript_13101/g.35284  ORF Transcript_13101/g.35284 Transcript_13101/m.35284 type:complete len:176 (+) Transcript_13101:254-781(+)|eukprot:CAMPEP_0185833834 /NCGR_PEP_ID=MMETSP1353-20130828/3570_1 /TAXON_ID=1077150 /ORGANISM="Erythrolobus australicus, Strain CCMP3124" /LENGTH=175 /DNA_ID=CAMNT_0028532167 /DNA_START=254 /DNA_END=781 /DNA_ORIENTATION=+